MKTLEKIKLNQFNKAELERRAMNVLLGGCGVCATCACTCSPSYGPYADPTDNGGDNSAGGPLPNYN